MYPMSGCFKIVLFNCLVISLLGQFLSKETKLLMQRNPDTQASCVKGYIYCGHELMGFVNVVDHYLYQCSPESGKDLLELKKCSSECIQGGTSFCSTTCTAGILYCGYELTQLNFVGASDDTLYECLSDGKSFIENRACEGACKKSSKNSYCIDDCAEDEKYCGYQLAELNGWAGHDHWPAWKQQSVFVCQNKADALLTKICPTNCIGKGDSVRCSIDRCVQGNYYCGSELSQIWPNMTLNPSILYICRNGVPIVARACESRCVERNKTRHAHCFTGCSEKYYYCGHELQNLGFDSDPNSLYYCRTKLRPEKIQTCSKSCVGSSRPYCSEECIPGWMYCGRELNDQYNSIHVEDNDIYQCRNITDLLHVRSCTHCTYDSGGLPMCSSEKCFEGDYHCGSELHNKWTNMTFNPSVLYVCRNGVPIVSKVCASRCVESTRIRKAHCRPECSANYYYCGHELQNLGFDSDPNSLYYCRTKLRPEIIQTCSNNCVGSSRPYCRQECVPGWMYCGHELNDQYNLIHVEDNNIYQCQNITDLLHVRSCTHCSYDSNHFPMCSSDKCIEGNYHCGSELHNKWANITFNPSVLYVCRNGVPIIAEACDIRCVENNGMTQALCFRNE